ncbi:pilus motility taxis protein HmpF [Myxosarcina sp. GI1(2024)]
MLYLAEIQKQSKGFIGGVATKLKLLACQRNDQTWSVVTANESVALEEANDFGDGALVIVNLGVNRQVLSKPESASQRIVGILLGFTRLLEKTKNQEQEIEQWKESLTIQSEELSRRELEMETRLEHLEQMEEEFERLEQQRLEISQAQAEIEQVKAEIEAKRKELSGAWVQLQGKQEQLQQFQESKILDEAQTTQIRGQLQALSSALDFSNAIKEQLNLAFKTANVQQGNFFPSWQKLEQYLQDIQEIEKKLTEGKSRLESSQQELESLTVSIAETERQLQKERQSLAVKRELTKFLNSQTQSHTTMLQTLGEPDLETLERERQKLDIEALENIPLPDLVKIVENLEKDLEKVARFVSDQEEELSWQCKAVEDLEAKVAVAQEFERLTLEQELADEKEAKKMLDQTLIGQRRSLKERYEILLRHTRILKRRQGIIDSEVESTAIDLEPIKQSLQQQQQKLLEQQQHLEREITQIETNIRQLETAITDREERQAKLTVEIQQQEANCQQLNLELAALKSKSEFCQENLQPLQDSLNSLREELKVIERTIAEYSQTSPDSALSALDRILQELTV